MREYKVEKEGWEAVVFVLAIAALCFGLGWVFCGLQANACEPCVQPEPKCGYKQVVNPATGELEQEYVCK